MRIFAYICFGVAGWTFLSRGMSALISMDASTLGLAIVMGFFIGIGFLALRFAEKEEEARLEAEFRELDSKKGANQ